MVPPLAGRARAVAAAPGGDHHEIASAEQTGPGLAVHDQPQGDEVWSTQALTLLGAQNLGTPAVGVCRSVAREVPRVTSAWIRRC